MEVTRVLVLIMAYILSNLPITKFAPKLPRKTLSNRLWQVAVL
jgi:hypothetical protein